MATSYKQLTMKMTGMNAAEYKRAYTTYAARVRNFNTVAGTNVKPAKSFYESIKYKDSLSPLQQSISMTPATRAHRVGEKIVSATTQNIAQAQVYDAWRGAISKSATVSQLWEDYKNGKITLAEFSKRAQEWSKNRRERQEKDDPITGSD